MDKAYIIAHILNQRNLESNQSLYSLRLKGKSLCSKTAMPSFRDSSSLYIMELKLKNMFFVQVMELQYSISIQKISF